LKNDTKSIPLLSIISEIGIGRDAFYSHLKVIKECKLIDVEHKEWVMGNGDAEANEYKFIGL